MNWIIFIVCALYIFSANYSLKQYCSPTGAYLKQMLPVGIAAFLGHGLILYWNIELQGGQNLDFANMASLTVWLTVAITLFNAPKKASMGFGILLYPLSIASIALIYISPNEYVINTKENYGVLCHILFSVLALCLLSYCAVHASFVWLQDVMLKRATVSKFLPLLTMEERLYPLLWAGFIALSLSLISGFLFLDNLWTKALLPKTLISLIAQFLLGALLFGHYRFGWRGPTISKWTLCSVIALLIAYYGTKLFLI